MKMAMRDGEILLKDCSTTQYDVIKRWGTMRWSRQDATLRGAVTLELLDQLSELCSLPEQAENLRGLLKARQEAINAQRICESPVPAYPYPVKARLFSHQVRGANMAMLTLADAGEMSGRRGFGLLFEMGCGKTLAAIAVAGTLFLQRKVNRLLIIAPASVCAVWPKELQEYADFPFTARVLSGEKGKRLGTLDELSRKKSGLRVAVINYESVWREDIFERLTEWAPDMVIADESQRIKTPGAAQSKAIHRLGDRTRYKLLLSGTPVQNGAADLWSQYRFLDSTVFGTNFYTFRAKYAKMGGYQNRKIVGYQNLDELVRREHSIAYRVTKAEALDLPEQVFQTRYIVLGASGKRAYMQLCKRSMAELSEGRITATDVLTKLLRLQQLTGGFLQADGVPRPEWVDTGKLDALADILDDYVLETGKKLVVFARFLPELDAIGKLLERRKLGFVRLDGSVPMEVRGTLVRLFQEEADTKVFLGQLDTVGLGITLTAADTIVNYSLNFNYASYAQSLARIHRIGQKNTCTYINLVMENTVDERILAALQAKEDLSKTIVDDWKQYFEKGG